MRYPTRRLAFLLAGVVVFGSSIVHTDELTFAQRVRAQEAIEWIYYAHQKGATRPFEEAVPAEVIQAKVVRYLRQSVALEELWHRPVTAEALRRELERIAANTRFAERLEQIYAALDHDPVLIQECLARPVLVDRLTRSFYATDERFHAASRRQIKQLRGRLVSGELDVQTADSHRFVEHVRHGGASDPPGGELDMTMPGRGPRRPVVRTLDPPAFVRWRAQMPAESGEIGPVTEQPASFRVQVVLDETEDEARVAHYVVRKRPWDTWWAEVEDNFDELQAETVAADLERLMPPPLVNPPPPGDNETPADCDAPERWDNGVLDDLPGSRAYHTGVWSGEEMIVWGGSTTEVEQNTGSRYDPVTDIWTSTAAVDAPEKRIYHVAVWTGTYMIVWGGGYDVTTLSTGGRYDPVTDTWLPMSTANAPEGRVRARAVWTGSEMIVWGGLTWLGPIHDTGGRYDPVSDTWTPTSLVNAPAPRYVHTMVWTGSEVIVWGGWNGLYLNNGGRYDPSTDTWISTNVANAPEGRAWHTAVWTGSQMVAWGGEGSGGYLATGGVYDPATDSWTHTTLTGAPASRRRHVAVWSGDEMIVWGGEPALPSGGTGGRYNPATDSWTPTSTLNAPVGAFAHIGVWTGNLLVVWGGHNNDIGRLATGGRYDPATDSWTPTTMDNHGPEGRTSHVGEWTGNHMIIWGGFDGVYLDTGGRYDPMLDAWTPTATTNAPAGRAIHTSVWTGHEMIVWGGDDGVTHMNTGGRYDPISDVWTPTSTLNAPLERVAHTAVWTGSQMIVWGGMHGDYLNTGGCYDPASDNWTATTAIDGPSKRYRHTAIWTGTYMIVWGGWDDWFLGDGGRFDPVTDSWTPTSLTNAPVARRYHTAVWTGKQMVVWGGYGIRNSPIKYLDTGGRYDPVADSWTPTSLDNVPVARGQHGTVWTDWYMVVWGGVEDVSTQLVATGGLYDPVDDVWFSIPTLGAPPHTGNHITVWTGELVIVWGGRTTPEYPPSGGRLWINQPPDQDHDRFTACNDECDDHDATVYPGAPQLCDGKNNDCSDPQWPVLPADEWDSDLDGVMVCEADCDDTHATVFPGAAQLCGDSLNNDCDHLSWPALANTNEFDDDGDGLSECELDCNDASAQAWATPGEVPELDVTHDYAADVTHLSWTPTTFYGADSVNYYVLRAYLQTGFHTFTFCLQPDAGGLTASDPLGMYYNLVFYLVVATNDCSPGLDQGSLGTGSDGTPRTGRSCP